MLFQQPAKLGVLRSQRSLRVVHIAMVVDRDAVRQGPFGPQEWAHRPWSSVALCALGRRSRDVRPCRESSSGLATVLAAVTAEREGAALADGPARTVPASSTDAIGLVVLSVSAPLSLPTNSRPFCGGAGPWPGAGVPLGEEILRL